MHTFQIVPTAPFTDVLLPLFVTYTEQREFTLRNTLYGKFMDARNSLFQVSICPSDWSPRAIRSHLSITSRQACQGAVVVNEKKKLFAARAIPPKGLVIGL